MTLHASESTTCTRVNEYRERVPLLLFSETQAAGPPIRGDRRRHLHRPVNADFRCCWVLRRHFYSRHSSTFLKSISVRRPLHTGVAACNAIHHAGASRESPVSRNVPRWMYKQMATVSMLVTPVLASLGEFSISRWVPWFKCQASVLVARHGYRRGMRRTQTTSRIVRLPGHDYAPGSIRCKVSPPI